MPQDQKNADDQDVESPQQDAFGQKKDQGQEDVGAPGEVRGGVEADHKKRQGAPTMEMTGLVSGSYPRSHFQTLQFKGESGCRTTVHWSARDSAGNVVKIKEVLGVILDPATNSYTVDDQMLPEMLGPAGKYELHFWAENDDGTSPELILNITFFDEKKKDADTPAPGPSTDAADGPQ
jgi:hypothetical protein